MYVPVHCTLVVYAPTKKKTISLPKVTHKNAIFVGQLNVMFVRQSAYNFSRIFKQIVWKQADAVSPWWLRGRVMNITRLDPKFKIVQKILYGSYFEKKKNTTWKQNILPKAINTQNIAHH